MKQPSKRRGGALVIALLTLMVVMLMASAVLRSLLTTRRQATQSATALQAAWLAESAISRAVARLAADETYGGETWDVELFESTQQQTPAHATIEVKPGPSHEKQVTVTAQLPGIQITKTMNLQPAGADNQGAP